MSRTTDTRQKLSGTVPDAPEKTDATNSKVRITLDPTLEQRIGNRAKQKRWYYRNGGIVQNERRRAVVRSAVQRHRAKKKAEREKAMK
jgi:hypothetical protein